MERRLGGASPVILYRRNRALVEGRKTRVPLNPWVLLSKTCWAGVCLFFGFVFVYGFVTLGTGSFHEVLLLLVGLVLLLGGVGLVGDVIHGFWKRAHLSRHGRLLTGTVTKVDEQTIYFPYGGSSPLVRISYRFMTPTGEEQEGEVERACSHGQISAGDRLAILYADGVAQAM